MDGRINLAMATNSRAGIIADECSNLKEKMPALRSGIFWQSRAMEVLNSRP